MKCPICQFSEISENTKICPECNSDLSFLNDISKVSTRIKNRNLYFILIFIILIISAFIIFFVLCNFSNSGNKDTQLIEQLKTDNDYLQKAVADLTAKLNESKNSDTKSDTVSTTVSDSLVTEYIVKKDENLWIIAQKFYGDGHQFRKIAEDNNLKRPYQIFIGTKLLIKK